MVSHGVSARNGGAPQQLDTGSSPASKRRRECRRPCHWRAPARGPCSWASPGSGRCESIRSRCPAPSASPKSLTLAICGPAQPREPPAAVSARLSRMLAGLRSRCTMPHWWAAWIARAATRPARPPGREYGSPRNASASVPPSTYSIEKNGCPSWIATSNTWTTLGCRRGARLSPSSRKRIRSSWWRRGRGHHLVHRDGPHRVQLECLVDHAHTAAADLAPDLIAGDRRPVCRRRPQPE